MPAFSITSQKKKQLEDRMTKLGIREEDLIEKFIKGSGPGGQKVNKTSSCVYLFHPPINIEIKCQRERTQSINRFLARRELCDQFEEKVLGEKTKKQQAFEKIRRQKRRRSRRAKERILKEKHMRSEKKVLRQTVRTSISLAPFKQE